MTATSVREENNISDTIEEIPQLSISEFILPIDNPNEILVKKSSQDQIIFQAKMREFNSWKE